MYSSSAHIPNYCAYDSRQFIQSVQSSLPSVGKQRLPMGYYDEWFPVIEQFTDSDGIAKVRLVNSLGQTVFVGSPL